MNKNSKYSQWTAMFAITRASLRSIARSPSAVIFILIFPLIFIVVFGFIGSNPIRLELGIHPSCDTLSPLYGSISQTDDIHLIGDKSDVELRDALVKGRIDAILLIHPFAAGKSSEQVEIFIAEGSRGKGKFVVNSLSNIIDKRNLEYYRSIHEKYGPGQTALDGIGNTPAVLKETRIEAREYKMIDFILPGQLGFSILSAGVFGTAFVFFSLRQTMVLKRFFATPISRTFIVLGEALARVIFQLAGALIIIVLGKYLFGFTLVNGLETLINMLLLSAIGLIVFMGFGFVVSGIAPSESVIPPIANIVTLPQFLLSGTFFRVDVFPEWLQSISRVLPLTYLNDALRKVAFEGARLTELSLELSVLLLWAVLIYAAAVRFFRWE